MAHVLDKLAEAAGETEEREKFRKRSLEQCMEIVFGGNLRSVDEKLDPFWVKEAGLMAARLARRLGRAEQEQKVYSRLAKELPGMPLWQAKLDALRVKQETPKKP